MLKIRILRTFAIIFSLVFAVALALAQEMLQLGSMSYARAEAPHLRMAVSTSPRFFRMVGGVAFSAIAEGSDDLHVTGLRYDPSAADGSRLLVTVQRRDQAMQVRPLIFDWELIPIARFARDENGSAMTLFGQLKDKTLERQVLDRQDRIINYHPALDNTLLGQRLFQADILIIQPNAAHVFRDGRGLLLGAGEGGHDPQRNLQAFNTVQRWQEDQASKGDVYQSYVVGDIDRKVTFDVKGGRLVFSGQPYWAAWKSRHSLSEIRSRVEQLEERYESQVAAYNKSVDEAAARAPQMTATARQQLMSSLKERRAKVDALEKQLKAEVEAASAVDQMPQYSARLSKLIASVDGINPLVYSAVTKVMHYRALFKHYQRRDAAGYEAFVKSVGGIEPSPKVVTPTVQQSS